MPAPRSAFWKCLEVRGVIKSRNGGMISTGSAKHNEIYAQVVPPSPTNEVRPLQANPRRGSAVRDKRKGRGGIEEKKKNWGRVEPSPRSKQREHMIRHQQNLGEIRFPRAQKKKCERQEIWRRTSRVGQVRKNCLIVQLPDSGVFAAEPCRDRRTYLDT